MILNLSEYGQSLQAAGETPTKVDWEPYLNFIANRTNTVDGLVYKDDPTIAMVEIFGEICYPGETGSSCPARTTGTTAQMQSFFDRTENEWHTLAPDILVSSGGFSHLIKSDKPTGVSNGIPYQAIYTDSANDVCDLEVNSANDINDSVPKVTSYCKSIDKPWFMSAWSSCFQDTRLPLLLHDGCADGGPRSSHVQPHARRITEQRGGCRRRLLEPQTQPSDARHLQHRTSVPSDLGHGAEQRLKGRADVIHFDMPARLPSPLR